MGDHYLSFLNGSNTEGSFESNGRNIAESDVHSHIVFDLRPELVVDST